jgi:hypothetical protein
VWEGDHSAQILENVHPQCLHLVDPWTYQPEFKGAWFGGGRATSQADMDAIHDGVMTRFAREIAAGTVVVHRCSSDEARIEDTLDWVYIDGNHSYEYVRRDLAHYAPLVRPGGLIVGDDYVKSTRWDDGVIRAFDEFVAQSGMRVVARRDEQILLEKQAGPS